MVNKDELNILELQDTDTLIQWYLLLNRWGWPKELPNEEPPIFKQVRKTRRGQIMWWIRNEVGLKDILRTHNKHMTDEEFDDFWKGNHEGDEEAFARYEQYLNKNHQITSQCRRNAGKAPAPADRSDPRG